MAATNLIIWINRWAFWGSLIVCAKHIQNRYTTFQNKFQKLIEKHLTFSFSDSIQNLTDYSYLSQSKLRSKSSDLIIDFIWIVFY
ncbi:hypothetical protein BLOT_015956 [Blomia tropicalis]|nr:hypothetical protein BLOT_015956 [Blomia tropicalis]